MDAVSIGRIVGQVAEWRKATVEQEGLLSGPAGAIDGTDAIDTMLVVLADDVEWSIERRGEDQKSCFAGSSPV